MTPPRQVLPGTTYLVTRRCAERRFFLRPSNLTNQVFLYVLALAARRFGVQVHAFCAMSNHFHLLVTDPDARLPDFERYLNSLLARALNCALGRWEHFWAPNSYSAVALRTPQDVLNKAGYVLANPVAAGLVPQARQWPGPWSAPEQIGANAVPVQRPAIFFSPKGYAPATASLQLVAPPGFASAEAFRQALIVDLAAREAAAAQRGGEFLGVERVLAHDPMGHPASHEPRRVMGPRVAARDKWKRIEALARLATFLREYREAWLARRRGNPNVVFPAGTFLLRVAHGVACAPAG